MSIYDRETGVFAGERVGPLAPAPPRPSFSGIVADSLADTPALSATLRANAVTIQDARGNHLDDVYNAHLGSAADALNTETAAFTSSPAGALNDAGQIVPGRAGQVARYLPDADSDVRVGLVDPPKTPGAGDENGVGRERQWNRPGKA